jgi:peptidoglycan/LPS O-acetylase OafA/YrhL
VLLLVLGIWAFVDPPSFYERVASFPPLNVHFLRDAGAFQIGLGAALLLALAWTDALLVALAAVGVGSALHFAGHVIDENRGGSPVRDLLFLGILAAILLLAAVARWRHVSR